MYSFNTKLQKSLYRRLFSIRCYLFPYSLSLRIIRSHPARIASFISLSTCFGVVLFSLAILRIICLVVIFLPPLFHSIGTLCKIDYIHILLYSTILCFIRQHQYWYLFRFRTHCAVSISTPNVPVRSKGTILF